MQLDENHQKDGLWINACENGSIDVNGLLYTQAILLNGHSVEQVDLADVRELTESDFQTALLEKPEIVLIGSGDQTVFIHPRIIAKLTASGIGVECMKTAAACRTYMILRSEERQVWAWLWPISA